MKVFSINGYWKDDKTTFSGYKVAEMDCIPTGYSDDDIFFFGLSEDNIKADINNTETANDFVITGYELYEETGVDEVDKNSTPALDLSYKLIAAGANREKLISIVDSYGDPVDWNYHSLDSIVAEVWNSDINSGDEPEDWIINEICRNFNVEEVKE